MLELAKLEYVFIWIIFQEVGEEILPEEYGGTNGSISDLVQFWKEEVHNHTDFLHQQTLQKTDESLRPGRPKTSEELLGSCTIM